MNRLASVLDVEDVRVDVVARSKLALFVEAAMIFKRHGWIVAPSTVTDALIAREQLASTCLGHGVAIPHTRLKGLKTAVAAVIRLKEPLAFDGPDDEPVTLFVFLFVPEMATQSDLEILAEIAEMLSDKAVRERLKHDGDADFVYATIAGWMPLGATGPPASRS
ncbi:MAG TPA: PTS sugar transporter subunit IIA [Caldimonas sp.]